MIAMNAQPARYHVLHETRYSYESPVSLSRQLLHLTPRDCAWQRCLAHQISVEPEVTMARASGNDCFGNRVRQLAIEFPHRQPQRPRREHDRRACRTCPLWWRSPASLHCRIEPAYRLGPSPTWETVREALAYGSRPVLRNASRFQFESPYVRVKREFAAYARTVLDATEDRPSSMRYRR
jgi:transglutaminase-like putative cysteine protease